MWGSDLTTTLTAGEGQAAIFFAVDHCSLECVGLHAAQRGTRFEALEPLRQGLREHFGAFAPQAARAWPGGMIMAASMCRMMFRMNSPSWVSKALRPWSGPRKATA